ncbi:hypothetical protein SAMN05216563_102307 [Phytobacter palmae]|nr:hypothetical protein SAMN05216563_102307 [Phytobacter palmae]
MFHDGLLEQEGTFPKLVKISWLYKSGIGRH